MEFPEFQDLPDGARLWIYPAARELTDVETETLECRVRAFLDREWASHERKVSGACATRENRFLLVAADESLFTLSGCSMDALRHEVEVIESDLGVQFVDGPPICWRENGAIRCAERDEFRRLAAEGAVGAQTRVFNNTLETLGELRAGKWEVPLGESWHARAFPVK